jgi:hypothetical protein
MTSGKNPLDLSRQDWPGERRADQEPRSGARGKPDDQTSQGAEGTKPLSGENGTRGGYLQIIAIEAGRHPCNCPAVFDKQIAEAIGAVANKNAIALGVPLAQDVHQPVVRILMIKPHDVGKETRAETPGIVEMELVLEHVVVGVRDLDEARSPHATQHVARTVARFLQEP